MALSLYYFVFLVFTLANFGKVFLKKFFISAIEFGSQKKASHRVGEGIL